MKICFLVLSHGPTDAVERLVEILVQGRSTAHVAVHHDAKAPAPQRQVVNGWGSKASLVRERKSVTWSTWSHVEAVNSGLFHLLYRVPNLDWVVVLSGEDLPCRPLSDHAEYLARMQGHDALLDAWRVSESESIPGWGRLAEDRYLYEYLSLPSYKVGTSVSVPGLRKLAFWLNHHQNLARVRLGFGSLPAGIGIRRSGLFREGGLDLVGGSDWFTLGLRGVIACLKARTDESLVSHFKRTTLPSEAWFATVLANDPEINVLWSRQRHVDFEGPHPRFLSLVDLPSIEASECYFARKFHRDMGEDLYKYLRSVALG